MARVKGKLVWYPWVGRQILKLGQQALFEDALELYNASQKIAPFDDGELTLGGTVTSEKKDKDTFDVVVSYGNNPVSAEYAVRQHYDLDYNHNPPESALYLQTPFLQMKDEIIKDVADRIRDLL